MAQCGASHYFEPNRSVKEPDQSCTFNLGTPTWHRVLLSLSSRLLLKQKLQAVSYINICRMFGVFMDAIRSYQNLVCARVSSGSRSSRADASLDST